MNNVNESRLEFRDRSSRELFRFIGVSGNEVQWILPEVLGLRKVTFFTVAVKTHAEMDGVYLNFESKFLSLRNLPNA